MPYESGIINASDRKPYPPHKNLRVVSFEGVNKKPPITYEIYANFIKRMAEKMGCIEKSGRIVNSDGKISEGNQCEEIILGRCLIKKDEKVPVPTSRKRDIRERGMDSLIDFAKTHQPYEKTGIITLIKTSILSKIRKDMGDQEIKRVDIYTSVGSPLDYLCGVDGWVEIENAFGRVEKITFDLKSGNSKISEYNKKANLLLKIDDSEIEIKSMPEEILKQSSNFIRAVIEEYKNRLEDTEKN